MTATVALAAVIAAAATATVIPMTHAASAMTVHIDMVAIASWIVTSAMRRMVYAYRRAMHVVAAKTSVPMRATVSIEAIVIVEAAVSATIGNPYAGTAIVVVATIVVTVDGEVPASSTPNDRTKEVVGCHQQAVLPVVQDAAEVVQAIAVVAAVEVGRRIDTQEVVEVDLVGVVILLVVEIELVGHLVRQVESLCLCTFKTHCVGAVEGCHHKHQGENKLFHSSVVFICLHFYF